MGAAEHDEASRGDQNSFGHGPRQGDLLWPSRENTSLHLCRCHHTQSLPLLLHRLQRASTESPSNKDILVNGPIVYIGDILPNRLDKSPMKEMKGCSGLLILFFPQDDRGTSALHFQESKCKIYLKVFFLYEWHETNRCVLKYLIWVTTKQCSLEIWNCK